MIDISRIIGVSIPTKIQNKIDDGSYKLTGTQVRDKAGRIVCNLNSLELTSGKYFSPNIFIRFDDCTFISSTTVSRDLREELARQKELGISISLKIYRILQAHTDDIIGEITHFHALFRALQGRSRLTTASDAFAAGIRCASRLAANIKSYIDDYIDVTTVHHRSASYDGETYFECKARGKFQPHIERSEFSRFSEHQVHFLALSFLEILNNLNILSLAYDRKMHESYLDSLSGLEASLLEVLRILIRGIGGEGDVYEMLYVSANANKFGWVHLDVNRLIKYDDQCTIDDLISRTFGSSASYDENRVISMGVVIGLLEEIENLRLRVHQLEGMDLSQLTELDDVRQIVFNEKQ
jgi:hypothetical protein